MPREDELEVSATIDDFDPRLGEFERETLHDAGIERALLGGALQGDHMSRWFALNVPASAFNRAFHQTVAAEIIHSVKGGTLPDMQTIRSRLAARGALTESTADMLDEIELNAFSSAMVKTHADIILGYAALRSVRARALGVVKLCDQAEDLDKVLEKAFAIGRNLPRMGTDTVMSGEFDFHALSHRVPGVPTPWTTINAAAGGGGWYYGEMSLVMGARGSGKTGCLIDSAIRAARANCPPAIVTLEMTSQQIVRRQLKNLCGMDRPPFDVTKLEEWDQAVATVRDMNIPIYDPRQMTGGSRDIEKMVAWAHDVRVSLGVKCLFIDYAQKLTTSRKGENRTREMDLCADMIDDLAKTTNMAVIVGSQRSQDANNRGAWRSKDSIKWEDNAALVIEVRRKQGENEGKFVVSKNREDHEPWFKVAFDGPRVKYTEMAYDPYADE